MQFLRASECRERCVDHLYVNEMFVGASAGSASVRLRLSMTPPVKIFFDERCTCACLEEEMCVV